MGPLLFEIFGLVRPKTCNKIEVINIEIISKLILQKKDIKLFFLVKKKALFFFLTKKSSFL
jgi:hypothetical protein